MLKKTMFLSILTLNIHILPVTVNNITLPGPRTRDLVICNDSQEFYMNTTPFPMPWTYATEAISYDLLYALSANQLILSTKSVWHNAQFLADMWLDFATLSEQNLTQKYQPLSNQPAAEFARNVRLYQPCIQEIHNLYNIINGTIATHLTQNLQQISHEIDKAMKSAWDKNPIWLQQGELQQNLTNLFTIYTLYPLALANQYACKEISNDFILFIPQGLATPPALDPNLPNITTQLNCSNADIFMGLRYTTKQDFDYLKKLTLEQAKEFAKSLIKTKTSTTTVGNKTTTLTTTNKKDLGAELVAIFNEITIKKLSLKPDFQNYYAEILPEFNIFIAGHGGHGYLANIDTVITQKSKPFIAKSKAGKNETKNYSYKSSDFLEILNFFNTQLFMKSLTISSCYPAGKQIKGEFDITSKFDNTTLEKITYPIILLGSAFAPTTSTFWLTNLPPFSNTDISRNIYPQQKLYGPTKIDGQESFVRFFNFLNQTKTYEKFETNNKSKDPSTKTIKHYRIQDPTKKQPALETFTDPHPSYLNAANVFANIYNKNTNTINQNKLNNYISIKFPHTSWFTPARFKKLVFKISQVAALTKDKVTIPNDIQTILMDANMIPATLQLHHPVPFIPVNYLNQNYVFDAITFTQDATLNDVIKQFFTIQEIAEPLNIVIKKLTIRTKQFSNLYIFIHNDFGPQGIRNGYIFTNANNKSLIVDWDYNQPFHDQAAQKEFATANHTGLINKVIQNAQKTNSLPTKEAMAEFTKTLNIHQGKAHFSPEIQEQVNKARTDPKSKTKHTDPNPAPNKQETPEPTTEQSNTQQPESPRPTQSKKYLIEALELASLLR